MCMDNRAAALLVQLIEAAERVDPAAALAAMTVGGGAELMTLILANWTADEATIESLARRVRAWADDIQLPGRNSIAPVPTAN